MSMLAQSQDSVPPAPALMLKIQLFRSLGPLRKTLSSKSSNSLRNREVLFQVLLVLELFRLRLGLAQFHHDLQILQLSFRFEEGLNFIAEVLASSMSFWACSRLFQKSSFAIKASSSPRRCWAPATSKKPPQMRKFPGHGRQLSFDRFKHKNIT